MLIGACVLPEQRLMGRKPRSKKKKKNCFRKLKPKTWLKKKKKKSTNKSREVRHGRNESRSWEMQRESEIWV